MADEKNRPDPDDERKPDSLTEVEKPSWKLVLKNTIREFGADQLTDSAAGLTYFSVLSIFPGLIALTSILSLFGQSGDAIMTLISDLQDRGALPASAIDSIKPVLGTLLTAPAPGLGLILGILTALWSASNYVKAFSRAMNRIYEMPEGRPTIKYTLTMYGLTAVIMVMLALALVMVTISGPIAASIGGMLGLGPVAVTIWNVARWPILAAVVLLIIAMLYYFTPNVRQPKFTWISVGAGAAVLLGVLASAAFGLYVANFGNYDATYGTLAGIIIFLFWLWIINVALMFGAELDAELERGRQLQGGIAAEERLQLPARDTKASDKKEAKKEEAVEEGRKLREAADDPDSDSGDKGSDRGDGDSSDRSADGDDRAHAAAPGAGSHKVTKEEARAGRRAERDARRAAREGEGGDHEPKDHYSDTDQGTR